MIRINALKHFNKYKLVFVVESLFAGFYIVVTRGLTPILLVVSGYTLHDLLLLNSFAGSLSLLIGFILHNMDKYRVSRERLLVFHVLERITWFAIPFNIGDKTLITLNYSVAVALTLPTSIYMQSLMFKTLENHVYRRTIMWRNISGGASSIIGQLTVILTLAFMHGITKYYILFETALVTGLLSSITLLFLPRISVVEDKVKKIPRETEIKAVNVYMLLILMFSSTTLLNIAWIPWLINDLGAPDYLAASLGFIQVVTSMVSSPFWVNRRMDTYRFAIGFLGLIPLMIYLLKNPYLHLLLAILYSFSYVGTSMYGSITYSNIVKEYGVFRSGALLASIYAVSTVIAGLTGYLLLYYSKLYIFIASTILGFIGLFIALTSIPELAVVKPVYVRIYSRLVYSIGISGYTVIIYTLTESVKIAIKIALLILLIMILFLIYRTLYYMIMFSGG